MDVPREALVMRPTRHDRPDWPLKAGCWLLKHFQRIKKRSRGPEGEGSDFNALAVAAKAKNGGGVVKQTSQRSLLFRQNVNRTEEENIFLT